MSILTEISNNVPTDEDTYLAEDGLLHCNRCGGNREHRIIIGNKARVVKCICDCMEKSIAELRLEEERAEVERLQDTCFGNSSMRYATFENDNQHDIELTNVMKKYSEQFGLFRKRGKGLLLWGNVGTGKSYYAACIANAIMSNKYRAYMTNFATIVNRLQSMYSGKQEYIDSLNSFDLLIIDDLGTERKTDYMQEQVFNIIDSRYRSGLPLIVTTNLSIEEIKKPETVMDSRVFGRVIEMCHPIRVEGKNQRFQTVREEYDDIQMILGFGKEE